MVSCPECQFSNYVLAGNRYVNDVKIQRFLCKDCGFRFSDPNFDKNVLKEKINLIQQSGRRQICVSLTEGTKNLTAEQKQKVLQGNKLKETLFNYSWYLQKQGRKETTILTYTNALKSLSRYCDLSDSEEVKGIIATKFKTNTTKRLITFSYSAYLKFQGKTWDKPNYRPEHKLPFIPTEKELILAKSTGSQISIVFTNFLDETGARCKEAERLEWADINEENCLVTLKASKNGCSRIVPIPQQLINILNTIPKTDSTVFPKVAKNSRTNSFRNRMKSLARKYKNPRFLKFHLHTFRHCKALREFHRTRLLTHVKKIMGHRSILTTMRYVEVYEQIYGITTRKEFETQIASTKKERCDLINAGWDLVSKSGEDWYFKKPK